MSYQPSLTHNPELNDDTCFINFFVVRLGSVAPESLTGILLRVVKTPASSTTLQRDCVKTLTAGYFGNKEKHKRARFKGMSAYGRVVAQIHQRLGCGDALEEETLLGVLCLCFYENVVISQSAGWLTQYSGISRLVNGYFASSNDLVGD